MSPSMKVGIAGIVIALILLIIGIPFWAVALVFVVAAAIPVGGYLALDKSQRRRLKAIRSRQRGELSGPAPDNARDACQSRRSSAE